MKTYENFTFQDRSSQSAKAKQEKLDLLRAKAPIDPALQRARVLASEKREADRVERKASRTAADAAAKQAALDLKAADEKAEAARLAASKPVLNEEERKLVRDAKYAARKNRR